MRMQKKMLERQFSWTQRLLIPMTSSRKYRTILFIGFVFFSLYYLSSSSSLREKKKTNQQALLRHATTKNQCELYMAPSSEPKAGMGIFIAKDISKGENVSPDHAPSIVITDPDMEKHSWADLFRTYWWGVHGGFEDALYEANLAATFETTLSGLPNAHTYLHNMNSQFPPNVYDDSLVYHHDHHHRHHRDVGAGAFSYHTSRLMSASRDIEAGEELFIPYPPKYFDLPWMKSVPRYDDYIQAGQILYDTKDMFQSLLRNDPSNDEAIDTVLNILQETSKSFSPRVASLMPQTKKDLQKILQQPQDAKEMSLLVAKELSVNRRSVDWLRENGLCLDHLQSSKSTLPHAGLGAFARRPISKGDIILPVPLLQVANRNDLQYSFDVDHHHYESQQLLLNYCFGNKESSLLLCPLTNANLINHCSQRQDKCGKNGPNAEIRWSSDWDSISQKWLHKSYEEIIKEPGRGLSFEVVALRDIDAGEEVFIDYGKGWEQAWDEHVANWEPVQEGPFKEHVSVKIMNDEMKPVKVNPNLTKLESNQANIITACVYWNDKNIVKEWDEAPDDPKWSKSRMEKIIKKYSVDGRLFDMKGKISRQNYWPCNVVAHDDEKDMYTVRIFQSHLHSKTIWERKKLPLFIRNYPRSSIRYFHDKYTSDQHLPNAFRHFIEIDDDMFPDEWKNLKNRK